MFGLMKQPPRGAAEDLTPVKGRRLGAASAGARSGAIDAYTSSLVALAASALPPINGRTMASLERYFRLEPSQKPALRRLIADSFQSPPQSGAVIRSFKRSTSARHDDCHRLFAGLCALARSVEAYDAVTMRNIAAAGKALGLKQDAVLSAVKRAGLAA